MPNTSARKILESALLGKRIRFMKNVEGTTMTGETEAIRTIMGDGSYLKFCWVTGRGPYNHILLHVGEEFELLEEEDSKDA